MHRQHISTGLLIALAVAPMAGLMYWADAAQSRSPADLEFADRCMAWAHRGAESRQLDTQPIADRCDRYFRVRSERDAEDDEKRWASTNDRLKEKEN